MPFPLQWPVPFRLQFHLAHKADLGRRLEGQVMTSGGFNPIDFLAVGKEDKGPQKGNQFGVIKSLLHGLGDTWFLTACLFYQACH